MVRPFNVFVLVLTLGLTSSPAIAQQHVSADDTTVDCATFNDDLRAQMSEMMGATLVPWVHVLKDAPTERADIQEGTLTFSKAGNSWLQCVEKNDLLWAPASPMGFLRRVVTLRDDGEQLVFETEASGFADVIQRGRVEVETGASGADVSETGPGTSSEASMATAQAQLQDLGHELNDDGFHQAVQQGDLDVVQLYLAAGAAPNTTVRFFGAPTPVLYFAAANGLVETTRFLLQAGADPNGTGKEGPILASKAADQPAIVRLFVEHGADLERPDGMGLRPLHAAVYNHGIQQPCVPASIRLLLDGGANPDALTATSEGEDNPDGITALMLAAQKGCTDVASVLLEGGADPSLSHSTTGKIAADYAAENGHDVLEASLRRASTSAE